MALVFRGDSGPLEIAGCFASAVGRLREADLRMIGSTGGTIGADFLTISGGGVVGAGEDAAAWRGGVRGGGGGVMAAVFPGIMGSDEVGAAVTPVRRTNGTIGGLIAGVTDVGAGGAELTGSGTLGMGEGGLIEGVMDAGADGAELTGVGMLDVSGGGLTDGARMGADFATGSGIFGVAAWPMPSGGVTFGADGAASAGFGSDSEAGRVSDDVIGKPPLSSAWRGSGGGVGTSGGCGASGSGTRDVDLASTEGGSDGGSTVRAVSLRPGSLFFGMLTVSLVIMGSVPVMGSAGGRLPCWTGPRSASASVLPARKTLACGLAMMTRGGASGTRPVEVGTLPVLVGTRPVPVGSGGGRFDGVDGSDEALAGTTPVSGGAVGPGPARSMEVLEPGIEMVGGAEGRGLSGVGRTSGSVLAREPVSEADCLSDDGVGATSPVGGRAGFCIGCVTAVDHDGMAPCDTPVPSLSDALSGIVAAVPEFARASKVESGFSGRGGKVTRKVSRFWGF
jgi:hypothetical protein